MPMYANKDWDYMYDDLTEFLEAHNLSELLHVASDAAIRWECKQKREKAETIPVKWIEGWLDKFQEKNGYRNIIAPKSITIEDTTIILPCVPDMLEDWRKENEID